MIKFAGGFAGVMSWLLTHPADVVKSRIQAQERFLVRCNYFLEFQTKWKYKKWLRYPLKRFDEAPLYKSGINCFQQGIRTEG